MSGTGPTPVRAPSTPDNAARAALIDCVDDAIIVIGTDLQMIYANRAAKTLAGDDDSNALADLDRLIHPDDVARAAEALSRATTETRTTVRIRLVLPSGVRPVEITLTNHVDTPGIDGIVACFRNLSDEEALRASLERQRQLDQHVRTALTDELTGLPNRRLLVERLGQALRDGTGPIAVFFVDLDDFKAINDSLGHSAGDAMLRSTARRLLDSCSLLDHWGRLGGDEFVLFLEHIDADATDAMARRLRDSLRQPLVLSGRPCHSTACVGVAIVDSNVTATEAVRRADIAMYEGKRAGRGIVTKFAPEMEARVVGRAELEGQLRRALIGAGPSLALQPIVELTTGSIVLIEALARWHSPTQGPIAPERFISLAEEIGVIDQLDRHIMRKACRATAGMIDPVSGRRPKTAVNISTMHLVQDGFAGAVLRVLAESDFDPSRLVLEVTESIGVRYDDDLARQLATLRAEGVEIALDDFGTGHSSLAQLETLEVDYLKVDRSFLTGLEQSTRRIRYVETIVNMADALDLQLVFEGIETTEQLAILRSLGVRLGQGFLLAHPTGADELRDQMRRAHRANRDSSRSHTTLQRR
jgi:diguanylate cyclase (GGDEF)-like protein